MISHQVMYTLRENNLIQVNFMEAAVSMCDKELWRVISKVQLFQLKTQSICQMTRGGNSRVNS